MRLIPALIALFSAAAFAQGGSAIITLVMPPPGGDGYSALQSGGAFAEGAASLYYNPALLPSLQRATGSQVFFTQSKQDLLPSLNLDDLYEEFTGVTFTLPDPDPEEGDFGLGFFHSRTSFGEHEVLDQQGNLLSRFDTREDVYALGMGLRVVGPASAGITAKYIDSRLAYGMSANPDDGMIKSWAFDLGAVVNPVYVVPKIPLFVQAWPSLSVAGRNIGPDVFYVDAVQADPIPTTLAVSVGLRLDVADVLQLEGGWDREQEMTHRYVADPVYETGFSVLAGIYRFGVMSLDDPQGKRYELHFSNALEISYLGLHRLIRRWRAHDYGSASAAMEAGYAFPAARILGVPFRANPRMVFGRREISDHRTYGIRDGQTAWYFALSL